MNSLESDNLETVHLFRQSVVMLVFKGGVIWILGTILFLLMELFVTATHTTAIDPSFRYGTFDWVSVFVSMSSASIWLHILLLFFWGWALLFCVLSWTNTVYILEPEHIITKTGIFFTTEERYNMQAMQTIEIKQGLLGKILNYGTIRLFNPALEKQITLSNISNPYPEANIIKQFCPSVNLVHGITKDH